MLSAPIVERWERCRREWAWSRDWELVRVTPLGAMYSALRTMMETEANLYPGPQMARQEMMRVAGERGVWTMYHDPYGQTVHYAAMAEVIARVLRQPSDLARKVHPAVNGWQPEAYLEPGGTRLMRVVLVDRWDDDRQLAELHSWRTLGDVCMTGLPMTMRVVVIGSSRQGKRHGHWSKARQHVLNKGIRFARKHGKEDGLAGSWGTVWREETQIGPDQWVEQMARDGVLGEVAFNVQVKVPGEYARERVREDIKRIAGEMERLTGVDGAELPMTRSACDSPLRGPCPLQCCCFAPREMTPGESGVFRKRVGPSE